MAEFRGVEIREDLKELIQETPFDLVDLKGSQILPEINVSEVSGDMYILPAGVGHNTTDNRRAADGSFKRTKYELSEDSYRTRVYGAEEEIDMISSLYTGSLLDEEEVAALIVRNRLMLGREKRVADAVFNTTTFTGANYTTTVGTKWDVGTADFREDIWAAHEKMRSRLKLGLGQMSLILGSDNVRNMIDTLAGKESIKYTNAILLDNPATRVQALSQYIGVKDIVVVDSMSNTTAAGAGAAQFDYLWDPTMAMLAVLAPKANSWKTAGLGRQPVYNKLTADYNLESYDIKETKKHIVQGYEQRGEKVFKGYGHLLQGIQ